MKSDIKSSLVALTMIISISSCSSSNAANNSSDDADISVYLELADVYADSGNYDKAIQTIENALQDTNSDALRLKLELLKEERDNSVSSGTTAHETSSTGSVTFYEYVPETTEASFSSAESGNSIKGKYEYYSGRYYYTVEFKSNGMCILTDDTHGYTHSRSGTYDYADGEYLLSFKMDDLYLASTLSAVLQGDSLIVKQIAGGGSQVNGEFIKVSGSDQSSVNEEMPATFSGKYNFETSINQYAIEFKSNGMCIGSSGEITARILHTRSGSYEYTDGEYIISLPFDDKYLATTYSAVFDGGSLVVKEIAGFGPLHNNGECVFYKSE